MLISELFFSILNAYFTMVHFLKLFGSGAFDILLLRIKL